MSELHPTHSSAGADRSGPEEPGSVTTRAPRPDHLGTVRASDEPPTNHADNATFDFDPDRPVLVSIRWKDAESQGGPTWEDTDEMLEFARRPLTVVLTVGVLLHMDPEQVAVTDTVAADQMGGVTKIPRGWIERIEVLGPASPNSLGREVPEIPMREDDREISPTRRVG